MYKIGIIGERDSVMGFMAIGFAVAALAENGVAVPEGTTLTRAQVAKLLYHISRLADSAPGLQMYR